MFAYVIRRVLATIPLLFIALYSVHVGVSFTTDPLAEFYQCLPRCQQGYDLISDQYDLDTNIWVRPFAWFGDAATGDLGRSNELGQPVSTILKTRGWNTAQLAIPAFALSTGVALMLAIYSATHKYSAGDYALTSLSFVGIALPTFVVGLLLQTTFAVWWQDWFHNKPFWTQGKHADSFGQFLSSATLPILTLTIVSVAADSRFGRTAMLEVLNADYIRTARAKGLSRRRVVWRHGLRNALIPLVTLWALNFSILLSGSVITESIFSWPGLGPPFIDGLGEADIDLVLGIVIFGSFLVITFNLIADVLYGVLDPRIRYD